MERITSQKKLILDYLKSVKTHPGAEDVYFDIKKKLPQISLGTVYRILNNLSEKNLVKKIPAKISRFDGDILPHAHYVCKKCQTIYDVFNFSESCKFLKDKKIKVGKIENYQIYFYGTCKKCSKKIVPRLPERNKNQRFERAFKCA